MTFWFRRDGFMRIDGPNGIQLLEARGTTLFRDHLGVMQRLDGLVSWGGDGNPRQLLGGVDAAKNLSNPNDYSVPISPAEPAEIGGRTGWSSTLAPPAHKQHPLRVVIDDETAAILEIRSVGVDSYTRLNDFEPDADIDETVFDYEGPIATDHLDEQRHHQEVARLQHELQWPTPRYWPSGLAIILLDADPDTGAFLGRLEAGRDEVGVLARWRDGSHPKRFESLIEGLHVHRWTRGQYNWALATSSRFNYSELAQIVDSIPDES
ncbi:MAG: hypothetical protein ACOC9I_01700 [Actinomycetota bacterium]